jgi:hypothetical protein
VITIANAAAIPEVRKILNADRRGVNKIYLVPEMDEWDVRIELEGGFAFFDSMMLSKLRSVAGVASVKEF